MPKNDPPDNKKDGPSDSKTTHRHRRRVTGGTRPTDYTRAHLDHVAVSDVTRAVGVSNRTLRRLFDTHLGMSWRTYLLRARVLRSMAMLAQPNCSVLDVSIAVGFDDAGAFRPILRQALRGDSLRLHATTP